MTEQPPLARELQTRDDDTLELRPDDDGIDAALGLGATDEGEAIPLVHLVFRDAIAGPIQVTFDTRTGHLEHVYSQLHRLLGAIHWPEDHPEDAAEVSRVLARLTEQAGGRP